MPDDVERKLPRQPLGAPPVTVDTIDELTTFVRHFPQWCGEDGFPLSWRHYVYGLSALGRDNARKAIDLFRIYNISQAADVSVKDAWLDDQKTLAGWG